MITVFTPSHNTKYLDELYDSLKKQTYTDWEWIVLLNGNAFYKNEDPRVRIFQTGPERGIGALKKECCKEAKGEWFVEVDHDDLITEDCLAEIALRDADFVYSNCEYFRKDGNPYRFGDGYGWEYEGNEIISPRFIPQNFLRIWYSPDHVRAWRKDFYDKIGGHNENLRIADDHELIIRTYLAGGRVERIPKKLYKYRVNEEGTWLNRTQKIQALMWENYNKYVYPCAEKWATDNAYAKIDLCGGIDRPEGYISMDTFGGDVEANLDNRWPLDDDSVGVLRAHDAIEHLKDPIHTMNEAYRVLAHGGFFLIRVPSTDGVGAWCDPTHVSFWNKRSFRYYTDKNIAKYIHFQGRFQVLKLENIKLWDDVPYVEAHLMAVKSGERIHGELLI